MKRCPQCNQIYADEIKFCLRDGIQLAFVSDALEERTKIRPLPEVKQNPQSARQGVNPLFAYLSVALFALLIGGAIIVWTKLDSNASSIAKNENLTNGVGELNGRQNTKAANYSEPNRNAAEKLSENTIGTDPPSFDATAARNETKAALDEWLQASINRNFEDLMRYYADRLDTYYRKSNVGVSFVRNDKKKSFERYSVVDVTVSNLKIDVNSANGQVLTTFDKTFDSNGDAGRISGAVQSQLRWAKNNGIWKIIGEKDLQIYRLDER